jgi:hypothetical protein
VIVITIFGLGASHMGRPMGKACLARPMGSSLRPDDCDHCRAQRGQVENRTVRIEDVTVFSKFARAWLILLWRDRNMPKGWLYNWVGMARRRKQNPETRFVGSFLIVYQCTLKLSLIDAQKATPAPIRG